MKKRHPVMAASRMTMTIAAIALAGCNGSSSPGEAGRTPPSTDVTIPASLFVTTAPGDAVPLVEVKTDAQPGQHVVFTARVGGRSDPFVANRAIFSVADPSLESCDELPGDTCPAPWDYCCEAPDNLLKHMATVQVVDEDGQPLKRSIRDEHGLAPLRTVIVSGTVERIDDAGNFVVNAETIHVMDG